MIYSKKIRIKLMLIILAISIFSARSSQAIEYGMLGGKPANPDPKIENSASWFIYNLNAGEEKQDAITIMNLFDTSLDVIIYPADSTNSSSGGFALKQLAEPKNEVGTWVKFYATDPPQDFLDIFKKHNGNIIEFCNLSHDQLQNEYNGIDPEQKSAKLNKSEKIVTSDQISSFWNWCQGTNLIERTFQSKESINIPFVISVPETADVGEHTGGILIQKKATDDQSGAGNRSTVKLTTRVGVRIYETVPGDIIRKLSMDNLQVIKNFKEFSFADWFGEKKPREYLIQSNISSSSNMSVEHENNILVKDLLFHRKDQKIERKFQILKKDKFIANLAWAKPLFGYYSFQAQIKYQGNIGEETLLSNPIKVWIMPWREVTLVVILLVVLAVIYYVWRRYQKKKYGGIGWVEYKVGKDENINSLTEKFKVNRKVLVKTNKIKAPYLFRKDHIILVPPIGEKDIFEKADKKNAKNKKEKIKLSEKKIKEAKEKKK